MGTLFDMRIFFAFNKNPYATMILLHICSSLCNKKLRFSSWVCYDLSLLHDSFKQPVLIMLHEIHVGLKTRLCRSFKSISIVIVVFSWIFTSTHFHSIQLPLWHVGFLQHSATSDITCHCHNTFFKFWYCRGCCCCYCCGCFT